MTYSTYLPQTSLLPPEIISNVFSFVSPNVLYEKLISPYKWSSQLNDIQYVAYQHIFQSRIIIRSTPRSRGYDPIRKFYTRQDILTALLVYEFHEGYKILKNLFNFNIETNFIIIPLEIALLFDITDNESNLAELRSFNEVLEIISCDNYYKDIMPQVVIQLRYYSSPSMLTIKEHTRVIRNIHMLGRKTTKFMRVFMPSHPSLARELLLPTFFSNLRELYLYNNHISDSHIGRFFSKLPAGLKTLDLTGNDINTLQDLKIPASLEQLILEANNIISLDGPDYENSNLVRLDVSVNAVKSLLGIRLPQTLKIFKATYNQILEIYQDQLPDSLEILGLSSNNFKSLSTLLPLNLRELYLSSNRIKTFPEDFFKGSTLLTVLDLSDNLIDDLDELGELPSSLVDLMLDNNEIDYSDFNSTLTKNLVKLSMTSTGMVYLKRIKFPNSMREVNFSKNEISEFDNVSFPNVESLNLSHNKLGEFNVLKHNIVVSTLHTLNIGFNAFKNLHSIIIPPTVVNLTIDGLTHISQQFIDRLPTSLQKLSMSSCTDMDSQLSIDFLNLTNLTSLVLERDGFTLIENIRYPSCLQEVLFEYNNLEKITFDYFPTNIRVLKFKNNQITNMKTLPYFPLIEYFGVFDDETMLMKQGMCFAYKK